MPVFERLIVLYHNERAVQRNFSILQFGHIGGERWFQKVAENFEMRD